MTSPGPTPPRVRRDAGDAAPSSVRFALIAVGAVMLALCGLAGGGPVAVAVGAALCALGLVRGDRSVRSAAFTAAVGLVLLLLCWISPIDARAQVTAGAVVLTIGVLRLLQVTALPRRAARV